MLSGTCKWVRSVCEHYDRVISRNSEQFSSFDIKVPQTVNLWHHFTPLRKYLSREMRSSTSFTKVHDRWYCFRWNRQRNKVINHLLQLQNVVDIQPLSTLLKKPTKQEFHLMEKRKQHFIYLSSHWICVLLTHIATVGQKATTNYTFTWYRAP